MSPQDVAAHLTRLHLTQGHRGYLRSVSERQGFGVEHSGWAPSQKRGTLDWETCAGGPSVCSFP